jgi:DTW domain-containing protein YfiP
MPFEPHAVHRLHTYRQSMSTKPYASRGKSQIRCELCLLAKQYCTCEFRQSLNSNITFLLLMYNTEVLKPSNSGRLIADLIPRTHAHLWSRTEPDAQVIAMIEDSQNQPFVVFPAEYACDTQTVMRDLKPQDIEQGKKPLFILLDGSWREAKKMFRKSLYLNHLPVLSFTPDTVAKYGLRKGSRDFQLGTAEVAALVLGASGEPENAASLNAWFELFIESSIYGRHRKRPEDLRCLKDLQSEFLQTLT